MEHVVWILSILDSQWKKMFRHTELAKQILGKHTARKRRVSYKRARRSLCIWELSPGTFRMLAVASHIFSSEVTFCKQTLNGYRHVGWTQEPEQRWTNKRHLQWNWKRVETIRQSSAQACQLLKTMMWTAWSRLREELLLWLGSNRTRVNRF